tara:strand:- start:270 stop:782 length:513 start_codon:yes stop_codon:yes gene_type:complete
MNILYLHGLNGSLSGEKRTILEKYGRVYSPAIDYESDGNSIENLRRQFVNGKIDVVMGSSMGGFTGYYLSIAFKKSALLFNPALVSRSVFQNVPDYSNSDRSFKQFVLGVKDGVVDPKDTLKFIGERMDDNTDYRLSLRQDLAHRIPLEIFEHEVSLFFDHLSQEVHFGQ